MSRRFWLAALGGLTVLDVAACGWVWAVLGWWQPAAVEAGALALAWWLATRPADRDVAELRRELAVYNRACDECRAGVWDVIAPGPAEPRMREAGRD
jgi:hypothetical protein